MSNKPRRVKFEADVEILVPGELQTGYELPEGVIHDMEPSTVPMRFGFDGPEIGKADVYIRDDGEMSVRAKLSFEAEIGHDAMVQGTAGDKRLHKMRIIAIGFAFDELIATQPDQGPEGVGGQQEVTEPREPIRAREDPPESTAPDACPCGRESTDQGKDDVWRCRVCYVAHLEKEAKGLREFQDRLVGALMWCSGSGDFGEGGKAHEGWEKGPALLLAEARASNG